jgi:hypothetical protein
MDLWPFVAADTATIRAAVAVICGDSFRAGQTGGFAGNEPSTGGRFVVAAVVFLEQVVCGIGARRLAGRPGGRA